MMEKKIKIRRRINYQKIFCVNSFMFILICILWYGGKFIHLYLDNKEELKETISTTFASNLIEDNQESGIIKKVNNNYYFYGEVNNNYVKYSNFLWRIVKINEDNTLMLVTDSNVGALAYGDPNASYETSNLINWLNNEEKGKFIKILNEKEKYLNFTSTCIDNIDNIENITCKEENKDYYLGLLSIEDYINTGGTKSFINDKKYSYLANKNNNNEIWYINEEGKINTTDGEDILGIKATITLLSTIEITNGTGSIDDPYQFEETTGLIGSYVKLDEDIWRIYEETNDIIKLVLQGTIKENDNDKKYSYSNNNYRHNDTVYGSLAYYLNNTYYKNLNYKNLILENTYVNGLYGNENYNYENIASKTIKTKISIPSIDDILFNDSLEYFTNTGNSENLETIYIHKNNGYITTKNIFTENNIIPCISIKRENLKTGSGTSTDPYRTE